MLLLGRSILESGLFDASPSFVTFLCVALTLRRPIRGEEP